ncbi:6-phosphogluconolactonase [Kocuria massiliensis]|uniref:6-phosphogluconolactonase n=1 Tax=Kocuria massiliensis TaxID=1926282 RepID=UPI0022B95F18|nr:6-phosphogluconolactonase [Kocuria massiliensis]
MHSIPRIHEYSTKDLVAESAAARLLLLLADEAPGRNAVHVSITGGSLGTRIWSEVAASTLVNTVPWDKVHIWWSDERFLEAGDAERNAQQTFDAFFGAGPIPRGNIHVMGSATDYDHQDEAASAYADELRTFAQPGESSPRFMVSLLGMGPDGHLASLFPGREEILSSVDGVMGISDSPKPPPERVTMTLPMINRSERIWFLVSGSDKREAFRRLTSRLDGAMTPETLRDTPAVGARGEFETLYLVSRDASGN